MFKKRKPIRSLVCNLSCDFKATSVMPTWSWNGTPVQGSHDNDVIYYILSEPRKRSKVARLILGQAHMRV